MLHQNPPELALFTCATAAANQTACVSQRHVMLSVQLMLNSAGDKLSIGNLVLLDLKMRRLPRNLAMK